MILYRYILKQHIAPFVYSLGVLIFICIMEWAVELLDKILSKGLDWSTIIEVFVINLAWMIALAIPMAILVTTLTTFGAMSADNEITAIKASGKNLLYLITPVFLVSVIIAVLLILFNDRILPDANHRAANLLSDISRKKPTALINPGELIRDFPNYGIYVGEVDSRSGKLKDIKIFYDAPGSDPTTTVAKTGDLHTSRDGRFLELTLYDGQTHQLSAKNPSEYFLGTFKRQVLLVQNVNSELTRSSSTYRGDREKTSTMMIDEVKQARVERDGLLLAHRGQLDTISAHLTLLHMRHPTAGVAAAPRNPDSVVVSFKQWRQRCAKAETKAYYLQESENSAQNRILNRLHMKDLMISQNLVEVHKKFSIPIACIVFVLIGAPLGIMARRGGLAVGAAYSIFFFIIYWASLIGGESLADKLVIPPAVAMWAANVLIGFCGIYLIFRMVKEKPVLSFDSIPRFFGGLFKKIRPKSEPDRISVGAISRFDRIRRLPFTLASRVFGLCPAYLLKLFFGYLSGLILILAVVFIVIDYVGKIKDFEGISLVNMGLYYLYYIPWLVWTVLPIVMLLSVMFAIGFLSKNSELIAAKAAGISIWRLTMPLIVISLLISGADFYFGEKIIPPANERRAQILKNQGRNNNASSFAPRDLRRNFYYFANNQTIYCFEEFRADPQVSTNVWRETIVDNVVTQRISASRMVYAAKDGWKFVNGSVRSFYPDSITLRSFDTLSDTVLAVSPEDMIVQIKAPEEMSYWELANYIDKTRRRGENVSKYLADLDFKLAYPFMNFIVILLGISVTARAGRKGSAVLFGIGLLLCFGYWFLSQFAISFAQAGDLPPMLGAWLSNIVFLVVSCILFKKALQ